MESAIELEVRNAPHSQSKRSFSPNSANRASDSWTTGAWRLPAGLSHPPKRTTIFRNALKGKVMRMKQAVPVQILRAEPARKFLTGSGVEDGSLIPAHFAWNLATGLYYKAKGRPWRLAKLPAGTCYVGVSFFQDLRSPDRRLQTSMAQVFTHSGDGFVLRGSEVTVDEGSKEAHLSERQAQELLSGVLRKYRDKARVDAHRVVIHKTSGFSPGETAGFLSEIGQRPYDLVSFHSDDPVRLLSTETFPCSGERFCRFQTKTISCTPRGTYRASVPTREFECRSPYT